MSPDDITRYRESLVSDDVNTQRAIYRVIAELAKTEHANFVRLCRGLLDDPHIEVRYRILFYGMHFGDRDDAVTEAKVMAALTASDLQRRALHALGTVGPVRAFPVLWKYARAKNPDALVAASKQVRSRFEAGSKQVRTDAQRTQTLALARQEILRPGGAASGLREASLEVMLRLSTALQERDVLLAAARLLTEDNVVVALGEIEADATTRGAIASELHAIRATYPDDCVEYKVLS